MRTFWFGEEGWQGTLCTPETHVDRPQGTCIECGDPIRDTDRGVIAPCSPRIWDHWILEHNGKTYSVCSYHLGCWMRIVENGSTEGTRVAERALGATSGGGQSSPVETSHTEDAEMGGGW